MIPLKIAEVILAERHKRNMTQEELAAALGVTAQSVSKWERGGYPDITLLPVIANYFEISVDTLIGNDELSKEADTEHFFDLLYGTEGTREDKARIAAEYARKYPHNHHIAHETTKYLMKLEDRTPYLPLIRELCEKIVNECTAPALREEAIRIMSTVCTDEEFAEKWFYLCAADYSAFRGEVLEERLWKQGREEESRQRFDINSFRLICHLLFRQHRNQGDPERGLRWHRFRIQFLEFLTEDITSPNAWLGAYAHLHLYAAHAAFGCGKKEEGYGYLEKALELFPKWSDISDVLLAAGPETLFGNLQVYKTQWMLQAGGIREYCTEMLCFPDSRKKLYLTLSDRHGWPYFNAVREEERFGEILTQAEQIMNG